MLIIEIALGIIAGAFVIKCWRAIVGWSLIIVQTAIPAAIAGWFLGPWACGFVVLLGVGWLLFTIFYGRHLAKERFGSREQRLKIRKALIKFSRSPKSYSEERLLHAELLGYGLSAEKADEVVEMARECI
jgi:hypothetical protein